MHLSIATIRSFTARLILTVILTVAFLQAESQYTINSYFGNLEECDTMTRGIYIIWWDNDFNYGNQVDVLLDSMLSYRATCLEDLIMADPPNTDDGYYYNVYIHTPGNPNCVFYPLEIGRAHV